MKHLIAALLTTIAFASSASAQNFTYEIYAGTAMSHEEQRYARGIYPLEQGSAVGVGAYTDLAGFEVGADFMITDRRFVGFVTGVETASLMLNGRYPFQIADGVTGYVGFGLGVIKVAYDGATTVAEKSGYYTAAGSQISLGARYALGANEVFAEIKHQTVFEYEKVEGNVVGYDGISFVTGFRF